MSLRSFLNWLAILVVVLSSSIGIVGKPFNESVPAKESRRQDMPLTLAQILTGLQTQGKTPETKTLAARNKFIGARVRQRGVEFELTEDREKDLRAAGASDELIDLIRSKSEGRNEVTVSKKTGKTQSTKAAKWREIILRSDSQVDYQIVIKETTAELNKSPKNAIALRFRADALATTNQTQLADLDVQDILQILTVPKTAEEYEARCFAIIYQSEPADALADCTRAIELAPRDSLAYYSRGRAYAYKKNPDYERAIADYSKAIEIEQQNLSAYMDRAYVYRIKELYDKEIADYTRVIVNNPRYARAYKERGVTYSLYKTDYDNAIADFTKAIEINPRDIEAYNDRANAYSYKNEYDRAIADYTKIIEIDPKNAQSYENRGLVYLKKGDQARANADYETARKLRGN
jgi:tetratricopeptide (TPR) repeat protein